MTVSQALAIYVEEHVPTIAAPERALYAVEVLDRFWGSLPVSAVKGETCRQYERTRPVKAATVRRELGTLRAALNHCAAEGYLIAAPVVKLPPKGQRKERYLSRAEAAALLRAARSARIDGRQQLVRFILTALYTGTRKTALCALRIDTPSAYGGWIDTERGLLYRQPYGRAETNKRQATARLPGRYLAHVRRWKRMGAKHVVEDFQGNRVASIRHGLEGALARAGITGVSEHTFRHTSITWAIQGGAQLTDVASYFGASIETIERTYWHHSPDHQESAVRALDRK